MEATRIVASLRTARDESSLCKHTGGTYRHHHRDGNTWESSNLIEFAIRNLFTIHTWLQMKSVKSVHKSVAFKWDFFLTLKHEKLLNLNSIWRWQLVIRIAPLPAATFPKLLYHLWMLQLSTTSSAGSISTRDRFSLQSSPKRVSIEFNHHQNFIHFTSSPARNETWICNFKWTRFHVLFIAGRIIIPNRVANEFSQLPTQFHCMMIFNQSNYDAAQLREPQTFLDDERTRLLMDVMKWK